MKTLLFALTTLSAASAAELEITFSGWAKPGGRVYVSLWKRPEGFPSQADKAAQKSFIEVTGDKAVVRLADLEPGDYAVSAFLDENANGALDVNGMRIPVEPYGFSNNARGMFGPPKFEAARFPIKDGVNRIQIELK